MKHAREDYERIQDPSGLIPEDEPVFLLRGQDVLAPQILRQYATLIAGQYGDLEMATSIKDQANEMVKWQKTVRASIPDRSTSSGQDDNHQV